MNPFHHYAYRAIGMWIGRVSSAWQVVDGKLKLNVEIPPNTTATVTMPDGRPQEIGSGAWEFENNAP